MKIDSDQAAQILREEFAAANNDSVDQSWVEKIERLSRLSADGASLTHIAFLGTEILAKAVNKSADLFAIKPKLAPKNPNAYSARTLCHTVLVPLSAELGFSIGVTGREPLNNQPYFRMTYLGDKTPIHRGAQAAFDYMLELIKELQLVRDEKAARKALRAFLFVRKQHQRRYTEYVVGRTVTPQRLLNAVKKLVENSSEGGRRAQAVVAGLMDLVAGPDRVESGRINDPSRKYPGDVCVRSTTKTWEKAIEVRDKPVSINDVQIFAKKCIDMGVRDAAVVMVSPLQTKLDDVALSQWATDFGIGLTLFINWSDFVSQALFWCAQPKLQAANDAARYIHQRLVSTEVSPAAVELWQKLTDT